MSGVLNTAQYASDNLMYKAAGKEIMYAYDAVPKDIAGVIDLG